MKTKRRIVRYVTDPGFPAASLRLNLEEAKKQEPLRIANASLVGIRILKEDKHGHNERLGLAV